MRRSLSVVEMVPLSSLARSASSSASLAFSWQGQLSCRLAELSRHWASLLDRGPVGSVHRRFRTSQTSRIPRKGTTRAAKRTWRARRACIAASDRPASTRGQGPPDLALEMENPVRNIVPETDERAVQMRHLAAHCAKGAGKDRTAVEAGSRVPTVFTTCRFNCPGDRHARHDITLCFDAPRHGDVRSWAGAGASAVPIYSDPVFGHTQAVLGAPAWPMPNRCQT